MKDRTKQGRQEQKDELKKVKWNRVALNIKSRLNLRDQKTFVNHYFTIV